MLGTWGTDISGAIVDEHHIMYDVSDTDREAFRRAEEEGEHFTVFENCPIVEHHKGETRVVGRGWVACTPIRSTRAPIGMLFNDTGVSGAAGRRGEAGARRDPVLAAGNDPRSDARLARSRRAAGARNRPARRLVTATVAMLAKDPAMGGKQIAARLDLSLSRLARVFKAEMGMSLVEYRNRLRLDRFAVLLDRGRTNLLEAALAAGFGSYAQFHRVFRALRHMTPREYLQSRG